MKAKEVYALKAGDVVRSENHFYLVVGTHKAWGALSNVKHFPAIQPILRSPGTAGDIWIKPAWGNAKRVA